MSSENDARINIESLIMEGSQCQALRVTFGPHHFVEIALVDTAVRFRLGATHHGFEADASQVGSELEAIIEEVRQAHPKTSID